MESKGLVQTLLRYEVFVLPFSFDLIKHASIGVLYII